MPVEHHGPAGLLGRDTRELRIEIATVLRPPVDVNARAGRAPVTAVVVAVDRVTGLDHRRDDVGVAPAVLANPVHEGDDRLGVAIGKPMLRPELEATGPERSDPRSAACAAPFASRRGAQAWSRLPAFLLPARIRAGATLPTTQRRPG